MPVPFLTAPKPWPGKMIGTEKRGDILAPVVTRPIMNPVAENMTYGEPVKKVYGLSGFGEEVMSPQQLEQEWLEASRTNPEFTVLSNRMIKSALRRLIDIQKAEINALSTESTATHIMTNIPGYGNYGMTSMIKELVGEDGYHKIQIILDTAYKLRQQLSRYKNELYGLPEAWKTIVFNFIEFDSMQFKAQPGFSGIGVAIAILAGIALVGGTVSVLKISDDQRRRKVAEAEAALSESEAIRATANAKALEIAAEHPELMETVRNSIDAQNEQLRATKDRINRDGKNAGIEMAIWEALSPAVKVMGFGIAAWFVFSMATTGGVWKAVKQMGSNVSSVFRSIGGRPTPVGVGIKRQLEITERDIARETQLKPIREKLYKRKKELAKVRRVPGERPREGLGVVESLEEYL
jgi:hypothetical protein